MKYIIECRVRQAGFGGWFTSIFTWWRCKIDVDLIEPEVLCKLLKCVEYEFNPVAKKRGK